MEEPGMIKCCCWTTQGTYWLQARYVDSLDCKSQPSGLRWWMEDSLVGYRSIYGHHAPPALPTNSTISHKLNTKAQLFHRRWTTRLVLWYDNDTGRQLREFLLNDNKITILIHLKSAFVRKCRPLGSAARGGPPPPPPLATPLPFRGSCCAPQSPVFDGSLMDGSGVGNIRPLVLLSRCWWRTFYFFYGTGYSYCGSSVVYPQEFTCLVLCTQSLHLPK